MRVSPSVKRSTAGVIAAVAWLALAFQLVGTIGASRAAGNSAIDGLLAYLSYFTIQTNALIAVLMTVALLRPESHSPLLRASVMSAAAVYIAIAGLLYRSYLYGFLHPHGLMVLADVALHEAVPLLFLMFWLLFVPKGTLNWTHPFVWLIYPVIYLACVFIVGAWTGRYPYPLLDAGMLKQARVLRHAAGFLIYCLVLGMVLVALDRWRGTATAINWLKKHMRNFIRW